MKKIGIMQPYFFPYIGYFSLIKHTDSFILFDTVQFMRHGWIERNRVLKENGEDWLYIKVPLVKAPQSNLIQHTYIDNSTDWRERILSQLRPYKKVAPYYNDVVAMMSKAMEGDFQLITELNKSCLEAVCEYIGIACNISVFSKSNLSIEPAHAPDEWALNICKALGDIDEYWNPPGGKEFFDKSKYDKAGIELRFQKPQIIEYDQKNKEFIPGLSIVDVLMFNSPQEVNAMLDKYEFV